MTASAYREWRTFTVRVGGSAFEMATKPGVFSHGRLDPATLLLAEHVAVRAGDVVVHLNCGNGLIGANAAARGASRVLLADRNVLSVDAARRTLAANGAAAEVVAGHAGCALPPGLCADVVVIRIPQERLALLQLIAAAFRILEVGGRCYIAGATNEGIKTATGTLESIFGGARVLARDSTHRVVSATKAGELPAVPDVFENRYLDCDAFNALHATLRGRPLTLCSRPGVFSWEHVDEATTILAGVMGIRSGDSVLDLGCGAGGLGVVAGALSGSRVTMVDVDVEAVRSAGRTAEENGLTDYRVLASDVASAVLGDRFDVVVTNPPFHVGKATSLDVPLQFIEDAHAVLAPGGRLYLVANRTLPYELAVKRRFGNVSMPHDGQRFKVLSAVRDSA